MARMHSRDKGKAGSTRPVESRASWVRYSPKEIELLVVKLSKSGMAPSQIGIHLRDSYGIPSVSEVTKKKVNAILREKKLSTEIPEDLSALLKRLITIMKHREKNKQDQTAKIGLKLTQSKINRLIKYYKKTKVLPADWKYDPAKIELSL